MPDQTIISFWHCIDTARQAAATGDLEAAVSKLEELLDKPEFERLETKRQKIAQLIATQYCLRSEKLGVDWKIAPLHPPEAIVFPQPAIIESLEYPKPGTKVELGAIQADEARNGISLVTCAMNRTENLLNALPTWLRNSEISEVVIVDWSSATPVRQELDRSGYDDSRIRVIRVEDEPRWILSYAFNIGFRVARCSQILKADADITLSEDFFVHNRIEEGRFVAGNWRNAQEHQSHINGFFFVHKRDLATIAGFNEFITTYGWDDEDIYERLVAQGIQRQDVAPNTIYHLPHSDDERIDVVISDTVSARDEFSNGTMYHIRRNRFLANVMPYWDARRIMLPVKGLVGTGGDMELRRTGWHPNPVPAHVNEDADYYALAELTSWHLGQRVWELDREKLATLTTQPATEMSRLDVEVLLAGPPGCHPASNGSLVVNLADNAPFGEGDFALALVRLVQLADLSNLALVLRANRALLPSDAPEVALKLPYVPMWHNIGAPTPVDIGELKCGLQRKAGENFQLRLDAETTVELVSMSSAPMLVSKQRRLYIDAQHGLGNRLRAIGSAAAISAATEMELVIIWQPDVHCDCRFEDLFNYDGPVLSETFIQEASEQGCDVYNYMTAEAGAHKDEPIALQEGRSIYARSAFVLNSEHSKWSTENRFIRSLQTVQAIHDLVNSVRNPNDVSAHIRMEGGKKYEHLPYEGAENWTKEDHDAIAEWRKKSHFDHFMTRLDTLIEDGQAENIFIAADLAETYLEFLDRYGDRIAYLPRNAYDRSAEQLRYAMADAILLSRVPLMLGSTWSSFSELAMRLNPERMKIEMSGKDF